MAEDAPLNAVELATELTIAWLGNPNTRVAADEVPAFLKAIHETVSSLSAGAGSTAEPTGENAAQEEFVPAVSVRKSLGSRDHIISMIDGKPYKTLRRHLSTHGLSPEQYRERYNLKADYPMVAPNYSETRRAMAKKIGLGNKPRRARAAKAKA
jgi:predicted transcriptional regulator